MTILCVGLASCSQSKKSNGPGKNAVASDDDDDDYSPPGSIDGNGLSIEPSGLSGSVFQFRENETVDIPFRVRGAAGDNAVAVALAETPRGGELVGANSLNPSFRWSSPTSGTHTIEFMLRDVEACKRSEGGVSECRIYESDFGNLDFKSYDTRSQRYTIEIDANGTGTGIGTGIGTGTGNTGTGTNNTSIINTLTGLLGAGGGGGGLGDLTGMLGGLDTGQLTQLLGMVQGGGGGTGGLDMTQLLSMLQGIQLTEPGPNAVPREVLEEIVKVYRENRAAGLIE